MTKTLDYYFATPSPWAYLATPRILNLEKKFDSEKLTAIEHVGSPLLVTAGPGSGKTRVITERIKFLLKTGRLLLKIALNLFN